MIIPESIRISFSKAGFIQYVRHAYYVGGYDIIPNVGIDIDDKGLEWVRTFNLRDRQSGIEFRVVEPEDLLTVIMKSDERLNELTLKWYGTPGAVI